MDSAPLPDFLARLRDATDLLEAVARDRGLLAGLPAEDRRRFLDATAVVYHPDMNARRQLVRATQRKRKAEKVRKEESAVHETGIRKLRRQPVFTTPNVYPPEQPSQVDVDDPEYRETIEPQHCYICKQKFSFNHFNIS